jgi:nucleoside-diphosphate-sugar epimerase
MEQGFPSKVFFEHKIDAIIHTATLYGKEGESIENIAESNLFIPFKLLNMAITEKCGLFINTDTILDRYVNPYALTKRQFQEWLYIRKSEIKVINMKLEHFYGPGAGSKNFITEMFERMQRNEPSIDLTMGEQSRDFVYIDDVVSAFKLILSKADTLKDDYNEYQVATMSHITIRELLKKIKDLTGSSTSLNFGALQYRVNELMKSESDYSQLVSLGWTPKVTLAEGLRKLYLNMI